MDTYIINMKRSVDRRKYMEKQLNRYDIFYEIVEAVDGKAMSEETFRTYTDDPEKLRSEVGCMLSHIAVYRRMVEKGAPYALILEDDAQINEPQLAELVKGLAEDILKKEPDNIILLTYYWCKEGTLQLDTVQKKERYAVCRPHQIWGVARSGAYILSLQTARKILAYHGDKVKANADSWVVYHNQKILEGIYCIYPMPVGEALQFGSEITYVQGLTQRIIKKIVSKIALMRIPVLSTLAINRRRSFSAQFKRIEVS